MASDNLTNVSHICHTVSISITNGTWAITVMKHWSHALSGDITNSIVSWTGIHYLSHVATRAITNCIVPHVSVRWYHKLHDGEHCHHMTNAYHLYVRQVSAFLDPKIVKYDQHCFLYSMLACRMPQAVSRMPCNNKPNRTHMKPCLKKPSYSELCKSISLVDTLTQEMEHHLKWHSE
jgi:hypothetical protein